MDRLLTLDARNYPDDMPEILRNSVRGIIFVNCKLLMIENCFGEAKLPGGGVERGESDEEALQREVKEETGYDVLPMTIVPFGEIEEKRLSDREPMIWHHFSRLYFCEVRPERGQCSLTENERKHGFCLVMHTVEEAIERNRKMLDREGKQPWNQREYETLRILQAYMAARG